MTERTIKVDALTRVEGEGGLYIKMRDEAVEDIRLEICSTCHPFFTGKQRFVDTAGRVERFQRKFGKITSQKKKG